MEKKNYFFTELAGTLTEDEMENFNRSVFMNMEGKFAAEKRVEYYRGLLKHCGSNVRIGCGVKLHNPQFISLGDNVSIGDRSVLIAHSDKGITLGEGVVVMHGVYLDAETPDKGYISVGRGSYIGTGCCLHGHQGLEIGEDCLLAQNITITPYSHKFDDPGKIIYSQGGNCRKVTIGRDCYLGMSVSVVYSADIGEGSVIGAGSVVVKTVPPYSVAVGVPAKVIKLRGK